MPRAPRIEDEGAVDHVIARGVRREPIVFDDQDHATFVRTLASACKKSGWEVSAWVLMDNHDHLAIRTPASILDYPWSSVALGYAKPLTKRPEWLSVREGLDLFAEKDVTRARKRFVERLDGFIREERKRPTRSGGPGRAKPAEHPETWLVLGVAELSGTVLEEVRPGSEDKAEQGRQEQSDDTRVRGAGSREALWCGRRVEGVPAR